MPAALRPVGAVRLVTRPAADALVVDRLLATPDRVLKLDQRADEDEMQECAWLAALDATDDGEQRRALRRRGRAVGGDPGRNRAARSGAHAMMWL